MPNTPMPNYEEYTKKLDDLVLQAQTDHKPDGVLTDEQIIEILQAKITALGG